MSGYHSNISVGQKGKIKHLNIDYNPKVKLLQTDIAHQN
jgi:hypothetical protein